MSGNEGDIIPLSLLFAAANLDLEGALPGEDTSIRRSGGMIYVTIVADNWGHKDCIWSFSCEKIYRYEVMSGIDTEVGIHPY